jgi:hypothetical protein
VNHRQAVLQRFGPQAISRDEQRHPQCLEIIGNSTDTGQDHKRSVVLVLAFKGTTT